MENLVSMEALKHSIYEFINTYADRQRIGSVKKFFDSSEPSPQVVIRARDISYSKQQIHGGGDTVYSFDVAIIVNSKQSDDVRITTRFDVAEDEALLRGTDEIRKILSSGTFIDHIESLDTSRPLSPRLNDLTINSDIIEIGNGQAIVYDIINVPIVVAELALSSIQIN